MKKVFFILLLFYTFPGFPQSAVNPIGDKRLLGFSAGFNYTNIQSGKPLPENSKLYNSGGFRLGVLLEHPINKNLSVSPKAELAFNNSKVRVTNPDNSIYDYAIFQETLELMAHIIIKKSNRVLKPYILLGPNIKLPLYQRTKFVGFDSNPDLAADIGIGLEKCFPKLFFAPELRYSVGLFNVNKYPSVPSSIYFHNIVFAMNFKG